MLNARIFNYLCKFALIKYNTIMHESDSIVIIPTYNEKENIEKIIRAVFGLNKCFHILVIDDGSPDGTASIVHRLIESEFNDRLFIIERQGKLGLGTAYITGFKWALAHNYNYITRWMPILVTILMTFHDSMRLHMAREMTLLLVQDMSVE